MKETTWYTPTDWGLVLSLLLAMAAGVGVGASWSVSGPSGVIGFCAAVMAFVVLLPVWGMFFFVNKVELLDRQVVLHHFLIRGVWCLGSRSVPVDAASTVHLKVGAEGPGWLFLQGPEGKTVLYIGSAWQGKQKSVQRWLRDL